MTRRQLIALVPAVALATMPVALADQGDHDCRQHERHVDTRIAHYKCIDGYWHAYKVEIFKCDVCDRQTRTRSYYEKTSAGCDQQ